MHSHKLELDWRTNTKQPTRETRETTTTTTLRLVFRFGVSISVSRFDCLICLSLSLSLSLSLPISLSCTPLSVLSIITLCVRSRCPLVAPAMDTVTAPSAHWTWRHACASAAVKAARVEWIVRNAAHCSISFLGRKAEDLRGPMIQRRSANVSFYISFFIKAVSLITPSARSNAPMFAAKSVSIQVIDCALASRTILQLA